jgi:hypothetical protein
MKKWMFVCLAIAFVACNEAEDAPEAVSTVDSNLADPNDTLLPELYIDPNTDDTSFSVALDSAGPTILGTDTNYRKQ